MFLSLLAVLAAASVQPAAAAAPAPGAPLRSIVYKVATSLNTSQTYEVYGGTAQPPGQSNDVQTNRGTVTIDVMAVANNALGIRVTEVWNSLLRPVVFNGNVAPDGTVSFPPSSINDVTRELLPFLGPTFAPADQMAAGGHWRVDYDNGGVSIETQFAVADIKDKLVSLHETQTVRPTTGMGMTINVNGNVKYEPSILAPISGHVVKRMSQSAAEGASTSTLDLTFERVSDTKDPGA